MKYIEGLAFQHIPYHITWLNLELEGRYNL
jgi:hypothetical protein